MNGTLLLAAAAVLLVGWGIFIFTLASRGGNTLYDPDEYGMCAPSRHANITANMVQERRRTLGPPAGWHEPQHVAIVPAPAQYDDDELDDIEDWDDDELEPESLPAVAVPDWPIPQTVEQPAVVTVNWTAARFASLEVRR